MSCNKCVNKLRCAAQFINSRHALVAVGVALRKKLLFKKLQNLARTWLCCGFKTSKAVKLHRICRFPQWEGIFSLLGDQHLASAGCLRNTDKPGYLCQLHFMWLGVLSQWLWLKSHEWAWNRREGKTGGRRLLTLWHRRGSPSVKRCSLEFLPVTEADTGGQAHHTLASGLHSQPATWRGGESISTYLF